MYFGTGPFSFINPFHKGASAGDGFPPPLAGVRADEAAGLEILKALPPAPSDKPPLLFLHGAFSGAWVWAEHFLGYMAKAGYPAFAVSFRGHASGDPAGVLWRDGLGDYVDDACATMRAIGEAPVMVGHSLGGLVAQLCLGKQALAGLVLMAPVPLEGLIPTHAQLALEDPALWLELMNVPSFGFADPSCVSPRLRRALFADDLPRGAAERHLARMRHTSLRALAEVQLPQICETAGALKLPALVMGRECDRLIPPGVMRRTAWLHRAELRLLPGSAHMTMLEARWRESADVLTGWLEQNFG